MVYGAFDMDIGVIKVRVALDENSLAQAMEDLKSKARSFNGLVLNPQVDDKQLTALNRHLDLKVSHYKQVQRYFTNNPLKVTTNELVNRESANTATRNNSNRGELKVDSTNVDRSLASFNSRFEKTFLGVTYKFANDLSKVKLATQMPRGGIGSMLLAPFKLAANEFVRETSRSFTRGTGIVKTARSAGESTGKFTVERSTEFGNHFAKNVLLYENGLKGLQDDIIKLGNLGSDFLHPEPFFAAVDKIESRFAQFLHTTFYGEGVQKAAADMGDEIKNAISKKLEAIKDVSLLLNVTAQDELKQMAEKPASEQAAARKALSPEALKLYKLLAAEALAIAESEGITGKREKQARVNRLLIEPESKARITNKVAKKLVDDADWETLQRPLNVLIRSFRIATNSVRKMNALEMDKIADEFAKQYEHLIPSIEQTGKKVLTIYSPGQSQYGTGGKEQLPAVQAMFPGSNVIAPLYKEMDQRGAYQGNNPFLRMGQQMSGGILGQMMPHEQHWTAGKGTRDTAEVLSGVAFGYSEAAARNMGIRKAAIKAGYAPENVQFGGYSLGTQTTQITIDALKNLGQEAKGFGIGLGDFFHTILNVQKNYQSAYTKQDPLNIPLNAGLFNSGKGSIQTDTLIPKGYAHGIYQNIGNQEVQQGFQAIGIKGGRDLTAANQGFAASRLSDYAHLANVQEFIDAAQLHAQGKSSPMDLSRVGIALETTAKKPLQAFSPKNLATTSAKMGLPIDDEFLSRGNATFQRVEKASKELRDYFGVTVDSVDEIAAAFRAISEITTSYTKVILQNAAGESETLTQLSEAVAKLPTTAIKSEATSFIESVKGGASPQDVKGTYLNRVYQANQNFQSHERDSAKVYQNLVNPVVPSGKPVFAPLTAEEMLKVAYQAPVKNKPVESIDKPIEKVVTDLDKFSDSLLVNVNDLIKLAESMEKISPILANKYAQAASEAIAPQLTGVQKYIDNIPDGQKMSEGSAIAGFKGRLSQSQAKADKVITTTSGKSGSALDELVTQVQNLDINSFDESVASQIRKQIDSVRDMFTAINRVLKEGDHPHLAADALEDIKRFSAIAEQLENSIGDKSTTAIKSSLKSARGASTKTYNASSFVSGTGFKLPDLAALKVPEIVGGKDIAKGLHISMKDAASQHAKDAVNIAAEGQEAFKKKEKIQSPSKVWAQFGEYMAEGLSVGFDKGADANKFISPYIQQIAEEATGGIGVFIKSFKSKISELEEVNPNLKKVTGALTSLKAIGVGVAAFTFLQTFQQQLIDFGRASFDAALKYESFTVLLDATSSSSGAAAQSISTIDAAVNKLNISLSAARQGYVQLQASTAGTSMEGAGTDKMFEAISQASSVYQLTPEQTDRAFLAIEQMASKGTVSAEELRSQLGEVLPGAMNIAARSMAMTNKEFNKLMETGQLATSDVFPKFATQILGETKSGVAGAANSAQGKLNRLNNSILRLQETAGKFQLGAASFGLNLLIPVIEKVPGLFLAATAAVSILAVQMIWLAGKPVLGVLTGFLQMATGATTTAGAIGVLGVQLAKLTGYSLLAMGVFSTFQVLLSAFGDKGGKFREWADASKAGLDAMSSAIDEVAGKASNLKKITSDDLKGEGRLGSTIIGSIIGKDTADSLERGVQKNATYGNLAQLIPGAGVIANGAKLLRIKTPFDKKLGLRTYAQEVAEAETIAAADQAARYNETLAKGATQIEPAKKVSRLNRNLEQKQLEFQGYEQQNPSDTTGIRKNNEELARLTKERDDQAKGVIATQEQYQTQIDNTKSAIKALNDKMAAGKITTDDYSYQIADFKSQLTATEKAQKELNAALDDSNKKFTNAGIAVVKLGAKLEDYLTQADYTKSLKDAQTYIQQINGLLSGQQGDYVRQLTAQASLLDSIALKQKTIDQMKSQIGEDNIDAVLGAFGLDKNTVGQAQLQAAAPQATTAQQKLVLENYGKVLGLNQEIAGMQSQYLQNAAQLKQQVKDTNKAIADYLRQASQTLEDTKLSIAQSDIQSAATQAGNAIKRSVVKFKQTFASSLIDSIVELIDLTSKLSLSAIQEKMDIAAATRKLQESGRAQTDLQNQLTSGLAPQESSIPGQSSSVGYSSYSAAPLTVLSGGHSIDSLAQVKPHHDYQTSKDGKGRMVVDIVLQDKAGNQMGAAIPSPVSGTVIRKHDPKGFGKYVDIIDEAGNILARMGHLSQFIAKTNQRVMVGETVALQGNDGPKSTGTHLHLEAAKQVIASYIPMLTSGKGTQLSTPTYNKLDGSAGRSNGTSEVEAFAKKTIEVANQLGIEPRHLFGIMGAESGFSPSVRNQLGATGLIQFIPDTAKRLGTTTDKLSKMSRVDQLDFVKEYFQRFIDKGFDFKKLGLRGAYGAVFAGNPNAPLGKSDGQSTLAYQAQKAEQNYGKQIDTFMAAAGKATQVSINAVASTASTASNAISTNFDVLAGVGKDQLAQARSLSTAQYNAEITEGKKRRKLEDENTRLAKDQVIAKASQTLTEGTRQVSDENTAAIRGQEDFNDSLGYSTPRKEFEINKRNIQRVFEDKTKEFTRKLEDYKTAREQYKIAIQGFKDRPDLDPSGKLQSQAQSSLGTVDKGISILESILGKANENRDKAIADIQQKFEDAEVKRLEQVSNQTNELNSQNLNQLADAAQKKLDLNPDDYSLGDPIQKKLEAQQNDLYQAYDTDLSAMRDMVRTGERTAAEAALYNEQRKKLLESSLSNAQADADNQEKAVAAAREQRRRERIDRLNQTLINNEQRNFDFKQSRDSIFASGAENYAANLRNSVRNTPMSYAIDQANNLDYQSKVFQTTNETQARLRDLMLEQSKTQERLRQINELKANPARNLEDTARLQQLQLEQSAAKTPEQINKLIELTKYLDAQKLDNLKQEFENLVSDRAKERLRNMIEIESNTFQSKQDLLGAKGNLASTLGFGVLSQKYQKESAINQQGFDYSAGLRSIDDFAEKTGASASTVAELKKNLEDLNKVKLASIEAQFNPFTQVLTEVQQGFQSTIAGVLTGSKSLSEGLNEMLGNIANSLANLAAQWITNELFGSLFGLGGKGMGGQQSGGLFGGGGGIGSIFSGIFGFADGGEVATDGNSAGLRSFPNAIGHAMRKEGANSVLATLTPGERVLTVPEAKLYRAMHPQGIAATTRMPSISNFATGGDVGMVSSFSNIGGTTTVNVPVTVEGGSEKLDANAISNAVRKGVIAEINNQRRANGLLSR